MTLSTPASGAVFTRGQSVRAAYTCQDAPSAPGISSCTGTAGDGALVNTSDLGTHTFSVTAVSEDGQRTSQVVQYTVTNTFAPAILATHHGIVSLEVTVPAAGSINVLETAGYAELARLARRLVPGPGRFAYARAHVKAKKAETVIIQVKLTRLGRRLLAHPRGSIVLNVWVTYTPNHGRSQTKAFLGGAAVVFRRP